MAAQLKAVEGLLRPLEKAYAEHGITPEWWVGHMKKLAETATLVKTASDKGVIMDEKEYADNRIRLDAGRELGKVGRFYPADSILLEGNLTREYSDDEKTLLKDVAVAVGKEIRKK